MAKLEPTRVPNIGSPTAIIESVVITWCSRKRHARRSVSVDLDAVSGIIWRHPLAEPVKPVLPHPPSRDIPHTMFQDLGACEGLSVLPPATHEPPVAGDEQPKVMRMMAPNYELGAVGFCWWDGNQWICPPDPVDQ